MSVFQRIFKVGEAKVNQIVDKLEKPEVMLEQAIRDKHKQISEAKKSVMNVIATERQTKAQLDKDRNEQANWEAKAEQALKAGREDLAVKALERATEHQNKADGLQGIWQNQRHA
jgi:phage shock protein A